MVVVCIGGGVVSISIVYLKQLSINQFFGEILHLSDNSRQCIVASEYSGARMAQNYYSMPAKNIAFFGEMQALSDSSWAIY